MAWQRERFGGCPVRFNQSGVGIYRIKCMVGGGEGH